MIVVNLVYGLTLPLLSLVLDAGGISKTVIGLSIVAQASGGVLLAPLMSRLIIRVGAVRIMQRAALLAAATLLALGLFQHIYAWFPLRFLLGASAAMLWAASETVINTLADDSRRGRILGIYGAAGAAGFAIGPLLLILTGSKGLIPFAVPALFVVAASVPLFLLPRDDAGDDASEHGGLLRIFKLVPYLMLLNATYAATLEAFLAFFPLYGIHIGIGEARSLALLTMLALGGVALQMPLGWLADHMDRHRLLLACLLLSIAGFALLPFFVSGPIAGPTYAFILGGAEGMIYTLGIILLGQRFRGADLATASVLFTGMWGVGKMLGPAMVGVALDLLGNSALPFLIAAIYVVYLPVLLTAMSKINKP